MKSAVVLVALFASACDLNPTGAHLRSANVRFVNALPGLSGQVGFTAHNGFVSGSVVAFPGVSATCSDIKAGEGVPMGWGLVNASRTGLSGDALVQYNTDQLFAGDTYIFIAAGTPADPRMIQYWTPSAGAVAANEAAVRFINAVPTSQTYTVDAMLGSSMSTALTANMVFGREAFALVAPGANTVTIRDQHDTPVLSNQSVTFNGGSRTTFVIAPTAAGGYQLLNVPKC